VAAVRERDELVIIAVGDDHRYCDRAEVEGPRATLHGDVVGVAGDSLTEGFAHRAEQRRGVLRIGEPCVVGGTEVHLAFEEPRSVGSVLFDAVRDDGALVDEPMIVSSDSRYQALASGHNMSVLPAATTAPHTRSGSSTAHASEYGPPDDNPMTPKRSAPR